MQTPDRVVSPVRLSAVLAAVNSLALAHAGAQVFYVDDNSSQGGDGTSWNTAFRDLQDALDAARREDHPWAEIRIAQGTYTPDRDASFALTSAVSLIGGFAGLGAADPDERDPARFVSILSGDLARNDAPAFGNRSDNSSRVVDATNAGGSTLLEGLTIRGGYANGPSAADQRGSAIGSESTFLSLLTVARCRIIDNFAANGAAVEMNFAALRMTDSLVAANRTAGQNTAGTSVAGILEIRRTRFADNINATGSLHGSAVSVFGSLNVLDSLFDSNGSGSAVLSSWGSVEINRSTVVNNHIADTGAIRIFQAPYAIFGGCIIRNTPPGGTEIVAELTDYLEIGASCIAGGESSIDAPDASFHWDPHNIDSDPLFTSPAGPDSNPATWEDNDYSLTFGSPCIDTGSFGYSLWGDTDLLGNPRVVRGRGDCHNRSDTGAIEFQGQSPPPPPVTVFVRADAAPGGDGQSWAAAFSNITPALVTPGVREIRVAAGTYTPHASDQRASFQIECQVALLGGFSGVAPNPDERDPESYPTILSGDLLSNDNASPKSLQDNSYVILDLRTADALIDGFIVERAHGPDPLNGGGGTAIRVTESTAAISRCVLRDCIYEGNIGTGGALSALDADVTVQDCLFTRNLQLGENYASGGAIAFYHGSLSVHGSSFTENIIQGREHVRGGAVFCYAGSARFVNCSFSHNRAVATNITGTSIATAGALYLHADQLLVVNCDFVANEAMAGAVDGVAEAGAAFVWAPLPSVVGSTFRQNTAQASVARSGALTIGGIQPALNCSTFFDNRALSEAGPAGPGGVLMSASDSHVNYLVNTILWHNTDGSGHSLAAQVQAPTGQFHATTCCIEGWDGSLPGARTFSADPHFQSPDDLRLLPGSPCIDTGEADFRPHDLADLDHDDDTTEPLPLDAANLPRVFGIDLDMGAFETQPCPADHNADNTVNSSDFFTFLTDFFTHHPRADFNADSTIDSRDYFAFLNAFFNGC